MAGVSIPQLLVIVLLVVLLFGTKKLRSLGSDLGSALKGFKKAMNDDDNQKDITQQETTKTPDADFASTSLPNEQTPQEKHGSSTPPVKNQDN